KFWKQDESRQVTSSQATLWQRRAPSQIRRAVRLLSTRLLLRRTDNQPPYRCRPCWSCNWVQEVPAQSRRTTMNTGAAPTPATKHVPRLCLPVRFPRTQAISK
ncbi:unnamed protein product, partial [Amoebophrya sp. A120]